MSFVISEKHLLPNVPVNVYLPLQWAFWSGSAGPGEDVRDLVGGKVPEDPEERLQSPGSGARKCGAGGRDPPDGAASQHRDPQRCVREPLRGGAHPGAVSGLGSEAEPGSEVGGGLVFCRTAAGEL